MPALIVLFKFRAEASDHQAFAWLPLIRETMRNEEPHHLCILNVGGVQSALLGFTQMRKYTRRAPYASSCVQLVLCCARQLPKGRKVTVAIIF
jgi:hypothetical protein